MSYVDMVLIVLVGGFALSGLFFGFFRTLGTLVGTIVAAIFTGRVIDLLHGSFGFLFGGGEFARVIIYLIVFVLISRLIGLAFWLVGKIFGIVRWLPFVKSIDHLLGGLLGFIEGIILVGFVLLYASHILPPVLMEQIKLDQSGAAKYVLQTMLTLELFLPDSIRNFILSTAATASKVIPQPK